MDVEVDGTPGAGWFSGAGPDADEGWFKGGRDDPRDGSMPDVGWFSGLGPIPDETVIPEMHVTPDEPGEKQTRGWFN